jgi:predicted nicotinamide N-methyase
MNARLNALQSQLRRKIPNARLNTTTLPQVPEIQLSLIDGAYPQAQLTQEHIEDLMDSPPYWAFCWASGQVMARYLLDNPDIVKGRVVSDFGCGSGVVAIAASLAGATRSIGLDIDPNALTACRLNADLNQVNLELCDSLEELNVDKSKTILVIADVFYDSRNIALLEGFINDYADVIIADSRVKPTALTGVIEVDCLQSCSVPDLAESSDFNSVRIYRLNSKIP